ncbi:MAG: 50S ribosomal protein L28 [Solobacterium sp.]|nr:50S ribosomal protein L28 [Solobacterium sp.]
MSRVCAVSGKKAMSGNRRSHSLRATRRKWNVNLQKVHMIVDGKPQTVRISARALKTLKGGAAKKAKAAAQAE